MADQTIWFSERLARDILVKIQDEYVPADFLILDMGAKEDIPLILGRSFLYTMNTVVNVGSDQIHFHFPGRKVKCAFNGYKANKQVKAVRPKRRSHPTRCQENKKDEQAEEAKQVKEDKPAELKLQPKLEKVWREKEVHTSWSPSPGPTEAPKA
jgi:hypothetical protein